MLSSDTQFEKIGKNSTKAITMTFRIDSNVMREITNEAAQGGISINVLVNQILKRYVEWDMKGRKAGMVPVSKPVIMDLFRRLTKEEVIMMSKDVAKNAVYNISLFMKGRSDADSFIDWFLSRMKTCSEISSNMVEDGSQTYILKHDLGENWSLYNKTLLELIFADFLHKPIKTTMTDSTLTLILENRKL
jgi:hypothetical protein